jgi:DNA repair exonuclease SbcCD ATPase subunit
MTDDPYKELQEQNQKLAARAEAAEARIAELDGALDILSRANQECNDALQAAEARVARYREAIQNYLDGNYDHPRAHRPDGCRHGRPYYEECETCIDEHFLAALNDTKPEGNDD